MRVLFIAERIDYEPQGTMQLSSVLKAGGHVVELVVQAHQDPIAVARDFQPDVVAYSVITGSQRNFLDINRRLKAELPGVFSIFGGPHPTFFYEMAAEEGVDGVCRGEGEGALLDLLQALDGGGPSATLELDNWTFQHNDHLITNPVRPYIEDLDSLPFPDRALVYERAPMAARSKIKHFLTGRGCPYNCTYCFNHALSEIYHGQKTRFRQRSVDHVIEELAWVRERYPMEFVVFVDDTFVLSPTWLAEFAERYSREIGIPFFCNTRANLVTEDQVRLLKEGGCHCVNIGIEAGNDRLRNGLLKRRMSKDQILEAARLFHAADLNFTTTNMIGLPTSTLDEDYETMDLSIEARPAYAHVSIFQPYPRTELGQFSRDQGWVVGTLDDIGEVYWDHSVLSFDDDHKRALSVLARFFSIGVEWPRLVPLIKKLTRVPDNFLFLLAFKLWKGWAIKNRVHPISLNLKEIIETAWNFLWIKG